VTAQCDGASPLVPEAGLHRLTPEQYVNSIRDLTGDPGFAPAVDDDEALVTERGVRQLRDAAGEAFARRDRWAQEVFPCDISADAGSACVEGFLDGFVTRAFRRPPTDDERQWLMGVYGDARAQLDFAGAMEVLFRVTLQSPQLVYRDESGVAAPELTAGTRRLTDYQVASRLSYLLWNTAPDAALLRAASSGDLGPEAGLRAQAERLLADERAAETIETFVWRWLQLDGGRLHHALEDTTKDADRFPEYDDALRAAMRTELEAFVRATLLDGDGSLTSLLTDRRSYVNGPLAELYGVEGGPASADEWAWVELPQEERSGLLTRAAFLSVFSTARVQAPIRRGVFVLEEMLCNDLGDPPPDVDDTPPTGGTSQDEGGNTVVRSVREDVTLRTSGSPCNTCHQVINPVGFTFENYDAMGKFRSRELGTELAIDSSGALIGTDVDGELANAVELSAKLAESRRVRTCFARRWMTRALGDSAAPCSAPDALERFLETGNARAFLLDLVTSDGFRLVQEASP
jgi:hypothetical protein